MLTVIIALFLLARAPSTILIILVKLSDILPLGSLEFAHSAYTRSFANIILITLHPISFAIYIFMSRRFRVSLRRLLGLRWLASDEDFNASSVRNSQLKAQTTKSSFALSTCKKGKKVVYLRNAARVALPFPEKLFTLSLPSTP
ncbi:unnamed protein product [Strongylus vulgaris]|uniref:G-protein coupled receptors family 1 profile domain-containing protein n=1 Tax=Strongylus vulgaris TaxID=40348 RepID=A0A3P7KXC9_STRVU|nr:unnamed protein product [Strongylus vulgaris]